MRLATGARAARWMAVVLLASLSGACRRSSAPENELLVLGAASLREVLGSTAQKLERDHPGLHVSVSLGGSQELRTQLEHGAPADVIVAADERTVAALEQEKLVRRRAVVARNAMVVVVPAQSTLTSFFDLPRAPRIVLAAPEVPAGAYALRVLDNASKQVPGFRAQVEGHLVSRELNVRQVLAKVALGEADAGLVYRTDVSASKDVRALEIPAELNATATYVAAELSSARNPERAHDCVELLTSDWGRHAFVGAGFLAPEAQP